MGGGVMSATLVQRRYPAAPLVGVAAAVFDGDGRVLLVQRGRPPRAGSWGLPGGLLDVGERLVEGAAREVSEECGIDIRIGGIAGVFEPITYDEAGRIEYHYVVVDYWASYVGGVATAQDDAAAVAWVSMNQLSDYHLHPDSQQVVEDAQRLWAVAHQREQNGQPA
jgi:ADP-ribose pyrophosphatase YjhB (NUDIX family)